MLLTNVLWTVYRWGLRLVVPTHPVSLTLRAEEAIGEQAWGEAFDLSHQALRNRADFAPAYFVRGLSRLHLDDYQGALHDLNRFLALVESPPAIAYYWRGWIYAHKEEWSLALADFERILDRHPDDPQFHYWRTYALWQRAEWDKMRHALGVLEALRPRNPLVQELRGHLYFHDGEYEAAEAAYTRAMEGGWRSPNLLYNRAVTRRHLVKPEGVREDIEAIFEIDPHNLWAHIELSKLAFAANQFDVALRHARAALEREPFHYEARISEVATLMALGQHEAARARLEELQALHPGEPLVEQLLGDLLSDAAEGAAAIDRYRAALEMEPGNVMAVVRLAEALIAEGEFEEAETRLDVLLAENPTCAEGYAARADLFRYTNRPEQMRADLDMLLVLEPDNGWARSYRAIHRHWSGDARGAQADFDAAVATENSEGWIWAFRGCFFMRLGRLAAAREDFQRAITLSPEDPWIRRQWAELLLRGGQLHRAIEVLTCLTEDEPEDGFARFFLADLYLARGEWEAARSQLSAIVEQGHELGWLAHAALAVFATEGERARHLAMADEQRPEPSYWGVTAATVLGQRALVSWLRGDEEQARAFLAEASRQREPGECSWLALYPLFSLLGAHPLIELLHLPEAVRLGWAAE